MKGTAAGFCAHSLFDFDVFAVLERFALEQQQLLRQQLQWLDELVARFPQIVSAGRPIHVEQAARWETSCETYLRGEMYTYSEATLELLWRWVQSCKAQGRNMNEEIWQHTARLYGRKSISEL